MRILALVIRILRQFIHDKRTMALMIIAPILVLTMLSLVFNGEELKLQMGAVNVPNEMIDRIEGNNVTVTKLKATEDVKREIKENDYDAILNFGRSENEIHLEGSDPTINKAIVERIRSSMGAEQTEANMTIQYVYGSSEMTTFDHFGPVLVGFFIFFFVFLIAGVSFLRERTQGTLLRLLASPIKRWELVFGYVIGFGLFTMIQSAIIALYSIYVIDLKMEGSFFYVLLITLMLALSALTLGILLSSFAKNELQMIQFIPLVVVPQLFFSGLFNLDTISDYLSWIGPLTPLYYGADALRDVMIRGQGISDIWVDVVVLIGFSLLFIILNVIALKKHRRI
ncbi:ABC transporter permease [Guptibacillus hwajinpoensis]|uniref:ABC-2 type transport system permease protein n=1 Tax=Guptibacillus hwajinpoensis TaxID=208199 RepID=A0ABU0K067_9BACL|nr:ABC transporter permease [Alkalihalobacillus hemicentroti]MDQ0481704.1 ABC-2 type transport system permease protein [Alkalihalobacillus hemicentroti]